MLLVPACRVLRLWGVRPHVRTYVGTYVPACGRMGTAGSVATLTKALAEVFRSIAIDVNESFATVSWPAGGGHLRT